MTQLDMGASSTLAIHGGEPVRRRPFPPRPPYGLAERNVANEVVATGQLSGFLAEPGDAFLGGPRVQSLERAWAEKFGVRHAVSMNSATSCLFAAVEALGIGPGDEVIVPPWTMSASAACVLAAGATPVFADIDPETYGLGCLSVADPGIAYGSITSRTRAIVMVDLFGCVPRDVDEITSNGVGFGVPIIEDAAQAIGAKGPEFPAGTIGTVGVFSLNRHKTLQCGEGGVAVTNDSEVAERLRAIRNHGEVLSNVAVCGKPVVGHNYRLGEIEAAIAEVQLGRLDELTDPRIRNAKRLTAALSELPGVVPPVVPAGYRHVYYLYAVRVEPPIPRDAFLAALRAEGVPCGPYVAPLYHLPVFAAYARLDDATDGAAANPAVERAWRETIVLPHVHAGMGDEDIDDVIEAFRKVYQHREDF